MVMYWRDLEVWKQSHNLVLLIYKIIGNFPASEKYALSDQIKRSAYSVTANIVEGHSRQTTKEFIKFLYQARGSMEELRYFLLLSKDLRYLTHAQYDALEERSISINKMLNSLITAVKQKLNS